MKITVLAVDDEPSILDAVEMALEAEGYAVLRATTGQEALQAFQSGRPDLVVLDRLLPDGDGLWVCAQLRRQSQVPILMLTALDELEDRVAGLDQGADDYLAKPFRVKELQARARALLRRSRPLEKPELTAGALRVNVDRREVWQNGHTVELTPREFDLLAFLMAHPGRVYSKSQLLESVWGWDERDNPNVVEVYVSALRQKLGQRELVRTVRGVGYAFQAE